MASENNITLAGHTLLIMSFLAAGKFSFVDLNRVNNLIDAMDQRVDSSGSATAEDVLKYLEGKYLTT